jgi:HK97 family phage prohead protease
MNRITRLLPTSTTVLGPNRVEAIAGTSAKARDGHIVDMRGMDLSAFMRSGTILWGHDPDQPVGVPVSCSVDSAGNLRLTVDFAPEGTSPRADEIRNLVKAGIVRNMSIGFAPIDMEPLDPRNPRSGQRITRCELIEVSFVSVPSDTGAIVTARAGSGRRALPDADYEERQRELRRMAKIQAEYDAAERQRTAREMQSRMYHQEAEVAEMQERHRRARKAALERERIKERRRRAWAYTALTGRLGG